MNIDKLRNKAIILLILLALLAGPCISGGRAIAFEGPRAKLAAEALRRAEELRRQWALDDAEAAFREAAAHESTSVEANIGLARIARTKLDYSQALGFLHQIPDAHRNSSQVLVESGMVYIAAEDPKRARQYFEQALQVSANDAAATIGFACVELLEGDYDRAEVRLRGLLARDTANSPARSMLARVLLETNRGAEASVEARRALALDAFNVDALYALAYAKSIEHNASEARSFARRAVSLDPFHIAARRMLSQYVDGQTGYNQSVMAQARACYDRGRRLKDAGERSQAVAELEAALRIEPRYYRAMIALGDVWLRDGDYDRAAGIARLAISCDSDGTLGHLELCWAYRGIHERARREIGAADSSDSLDIRPAPSAYAATREIFPEYPTLNKRQRSVIDAAVGPLVSFLPTLARKKARHYLLAYDQRPGDLRGFADVGGDKTFDGRFYDSLRGVGGRVAVSGIEYLEQAARGGFNTIAHEFAHQVHIAAMVRRDVAAIHRLYEEACREKRTLDHYAAANEYEYFAQGYEAFISERKRPSFGITGRHTRNELAMRDPRLYKFLLVLTGNSAPQRAAGY